MKTYPEGSHKIGADCQMCGGVICATHDICHDCEQCVAAEERISPSRQFPTHKNEDFEKESREHQARLEGELN